MLWATTNMWSTRDKWWQDINRYIINLKYPSSSRLYLDSECQNDLRSLSIFSVLKMHKSWQESPLMNLGVLATGFQTKFIPALRFCLLLESSLSPTFFIIKSVQPHESRLCSKLMTHPRSWYMTNFHLVHPSWFLPNSALTLFFICWECLSICTFLPSQL